MSTEADDTADMIELKDPDLEVKKDILVHHTGIYLMQTDRSALESNLKQTVCY